MTTNSVQPIDPIDQDAKRYGDMILAHSTLDERMPIYEYGRHVLAGADPSHGTAVRFFGALYDLTPRMPGYAEHIERVKTCPQAISLLQSKIALYVVLYEPSLVVLR